MKKYNSRSEVEEKYKWDLSEYFKSEEEFEKCFKDMENNIDTISDYIGCTKDSDKLYEYLEKVIGMSINILNLYGYAQLVNDQELGNSKSVERLNKTISLHTKFNSVNSFFDPELLTLSKDEYTALFNNNKLDKYRFYLDEVYRNKDHILNAKEELIVNELTNSMNHFEEIFSTLLNSEHKYGTVKINGEEVEILNNNYSYLMKNKDRQIRHEVYEKLFNIIDQYSNTNAGLLNGYVSMSETVAKLHNFKNAWEEKLFSYNIGDKVYKSLVKATEDNLESLYKYYRLRKEVLGVKDLYPYDLLVELSDSNREYSIEDAWNLATNAIKVLGDDYVSKFRKIIDNRNIDYCQYSGKCSGGYNLATYNKDSRILMSYNGDLYSVSTIAHEGGHHVNHQYMQENNQPIYCSNSHLVAEVASLTNEFLLSNYLFENSTDKNERLSGLENAIDTFKSNFFGSVREGKLEQDMHDYVVSGSSLTKEYMDNLTEESYKKYYGREVIIDKFSKCSWVSRSHYYAKYYIYSYAISASVAINCAKRITEGDEVFINKYKEFLKLGEDVWPIDAYKVLGFDLEDENVFIDAIKYFDSLVDKYHKLITER